ncbi:hypothetical protein RB595_010562 [Gaeumannomyces hyphopodioides]
MKFKALLLGAVIAPALAQPTVLLGAGVSPVSRRQGDLVAVTNSHCFSLTLPQFTAKRNARDPASLDWTTDDCTLSPENPLGFPFAPACHRHDFGYRNFKKQSRFTESNRLRIDNKFREDLKFQCRPFNFVKKVLCNALAELYYAAVRAFGGLEAPGKRDENLVKEYEDKLAFYNELVEEAKKEGLIQA